MLIIYSCDIIQIYVYIYLLTNILFYFISKK